MPPQTSPAGSGPLSVGPSPEPSGWEWSRGLRAEPDDHRRGCEQGRVRVEPMVVRVLVGRDKLFQTRAVIGWEDGEEDGRPGRRSPTLTTPPIMTLVTAALISSDDFVNVAHWSM